MSPLSDNFTSLKKFFKENGRSNVKHRTLLSLVLKPKLNIRNEKSCKSDFGISCIVWITNFCVLQIKK